VNTALFLASAAALVMLILKSPLVVPAFRTSELSTIVKSVPRIAEDFD